MKLIYPTFGTLSPFPIRRRNFIFALLLSLTSLRDFFFLENGKEGKVQHMYIAWEAEAAGLHLRSPTVTFKRPVRKI
jgi:hypothetical protein